MTVFSSRIGVAYIPAAADYTTNQFYAVNLDTNGEWELADTLGQAIGGVICEPADIGIALDVTISGFEKVAAASAVAAGDKVSVAADGRFKTAASTEIIVGTAQSAAGAAAELFTLHLGYEGAAP